MLKTLLKLLLAEAVKVAAEKGPNLIDKIGKKKPKTTTPAA